MKEKIDAVLNLFEEINKVPRKSKHEEKISEWLVKWAQNHGFEVKRDEVLNVLIRVPATKGYENSPSIALQGHMDMVCEKREGVDHDFSKDPIKHIVEEGWLRADGTTLGADDGIAIAIALLLATDKDVVHPPLELLFTVDEETGLTGANFLKPNWLESKILLNIDTEDEGVFTIGCAGGKDTEIAFKPETELACRRDIFAEIKISGLLGGHSGVDINLPRGNANAIMARILDAMERAARIKIGSIEGGTAHNAIPREAKAVVAVESGLFESAKLAFNQIAKEIKEELKTADPNLLIEMREGVNFSGEVMTREESLKLINMITVMPHGVAAMSADVEGLVETSNNFATIRMDGGVVKILSSQRSSIKSKLEQITAKIEKVACLVNAKVESGGGYPNWNPDMNSKLREKSVAVYKKLFGNAPKIEVIHAGLECGIIGSKNEGMDMISFGPTIKNPHTPDEKIEIATIGKVWEFTTELLKELCK